MHRILHIITDLDLGGAETMLWRLLGAMDRAKFESRVVSLLPPGALGKRIEALGIRVETAGMRRGWPSRAALRRVADSIRDFRPDLVQTWMYHGDLAGTMALRRAGGSFAKTPLVWGIHHTDLSPARNSLRTRLLAKWLARLSRKYPARIVCCAESTLRAHAAVGYAEGKMRVINNGIDTTLMKPEPYARTAIRKELDLDAATPLVGLVARWHPDKDVLTWIAAAQRFATARPDVHYLLCGRGLDWDNPALLRRVDAAGLRDKFHLLGSREDVPRVVAALDLFALSSVSEAFPLALAEAMAAGTLVASTDVGDARKIVGDAGLVVAPGDAAMMARAWLQAMNLPAAERETLSARGRSRIEENFSLAKAAKAYTDLYLEMLD